MMRRTHRFHGYKLPIMKIDVLQSVNENDFFSERSLKRDFLLLSGLYILMAVVTNYLLVPMFLYQEFIITKLGNKQAQIVLPIVFKWRYLTYFMVPVFLGIKVSIVSLYAFGYRIQFITMPFLKNTGRSKKQCLKLVY